mmetsp:Transcript_32867/g.101168  ORF Transcript_32867/g.101168 Transcript_32867/m.101168 type:complete len:211 (+) Transcript_32867:233-865(+)
MRQRRFHQRRVEDDFRESQSRRPRRRREVEVRVFGPSRRARLSSRATVRRPRRHQRRRARDRRRWPPRVRLQVARAERASEFGRDARPDLLERLRGVARRDHGRHHGFRRRRRQVDGRFAVPYQMLRDGRSPRQNRQRRVTQNPAVVEAASAVRTIVRALVDVQQRDAPAERPVAVAHPQRQRIRQKLVADAEGRRPEGPVPSTFLHLRR